MPVGHAIRTKGAGISGTSSKTLPDCSGFSPTLKRHSATPLPVSVEIGHSEWTTSIFYDNNTASYLLPVKADVRQREEVGEGDTVTVRLAIKG